MMKTRKKQGKKSTNKKPRTDSTPINNNNHTTHTTNNKHKSNTNNNHHHNNNNNTRKEIIDLDDDNEENDLGYIDEMPAPINPVYLMHKNPSIAKALSTINQNRQLRDQIRRSADSLPYNVDNTDENANSTSPSSDSILFSIYESNDDTHPLKFRCYKTEPFHKLLNAYCQYKQYKGSTGSLKWYGVALEDNKTPADFSMTGEERLNYARQPSLSTSSSQVSSQTHSQTDSQPQIEEQEESNSIILKVRYESQTKKFRIKKEDPLQKLLEAFCLKNNLDASKMNLTVDGLAVPPSATALDHDLEDDDLIDLKIK